MQIGSDLELLADGLRFLGSLEAERRAAGARRGRAASACTAPSSCPRASYCSHEVPPWNGAPSPKPDLTLT